jgi:O-antigen/teichoic acid export membrane protein
VRALPPRLLLTASFATTSALNYAFGIALAWVLVPADFGWLAFVQTTLLVCGWVLQTGLPWHLARQSAAERGPTDDLARGVLIANVGVALALGAGLLASYATGVTDGPFHTAGTVAATAVTLPFVAIAAVGRGAAQGQGRFGVMALVQASEVALRVGFGALVALLGGSVAAITCGFAGAAVLAAGLAVVLALPHSRGRIRWPHLNAVAPTFGGLLGVSLLLTLDLVALAVVRGHSDVVGYYQGCLVLANAPFYLVSSAFVPVLLTAAARAGSLALAGPAVARTLRLALLIAVPLELVLLIFPTQALTLAFPAQYATLAPALRILALGNALLLVVSILVATFQAVGAPGIGARTVLTTVAMEPVVLAVTVPRGGAVAAAATFTVAAAATLVRLVARYARLVSAWRAPGLASWCARYATGIAVFVAAAEVLRRSGASTDGMLVVPLAAYALSLAPLRLVVPRRSIQLRTNEE